MTPRDVDALDPNEVDALARYMRAEIRERQKAQRAANRKTRR